MHIYVDPANCLEELAGGLAANQCLVRRDADGGCRVRVIGAYDEDEALVEVRFYTAAWASRRPGVRVVVAARRD